MQHLQETGGGFRLWLTRYLVDEGRHPSEALANIREAIDLCLEDMESRGEQIPDPNNVLIGSVVVTR